MRIPKTIDTGTLKYRVQMVNDLQNDNGEILEGQTDCAGLVIKINKSNARQVQEETMMHELIHVALNDSGINPGSEMNDEMFIRACSPALYRIIKLNKLFSK